MANLSRADIVALDKRYIWHPYTPMRRYIDEVDPLVIERAEGARLFDADGRSYIDGNSSWWVATLGHNHPRLVEALCRQARTLCHTSLAGVTHAPAAELAAEMIAVAPRPLDRVFYSDDGSTAVEVALKLCLQFFRNEGQPGRRRFVALDGAYHGDTLGAASLGGVEIFRRQYGGVLMDCIFVPPPHAREDGHEAAFAALADVLARGAGEIAAVVLEPLVQGTAGMRIYDPEYLRRARALCDAHGALLVIDEVFTGYGRTGPMWACEAAGVAPDLLCTGKGFSGGMLPMAATLATARIFDAFLGAPERAFYYGHSFCGNPLGAAVAREVLAVYREEEILARAAPKAARIARAFADMGAIPGASRARALGMIGAIDLSRGAGYLGELGWRAYAEARRLGAYLRPLGDVVYVAPPLTIPDADLDELLDIVRRSVTFALSAA
ncbi:adenosylmethionine--8-amino-7-oxononanoate aminotransferase BioA [Sorangium cellulosum]|jgi:adenosylmethionine-8-amino-7-oxononanoate aminotransferase|uniref:Adenosylmethionine-8-amino-7-oxononanoate aminotransferase n=1 Tax=Sorangium cellulosum TaxID=56 RepID=A0A4V0NEY3_SORCE|nr:adenosylmethionine--8-amino-7-oxononanoate transaminase [Sorangium cellulosum]AUX27772.1 adenosylmethionine--8-amino-7-oxononanoate aminotransferase BioA [Sorangium cellulosum]